MNKIAIHRPPNTSVKKCFNTIILAIITVGINIVLMNTFVEMRISLIAIFILCEHY